MLQEKSVEIRSDSLQYHAFVTYSNADGIEKDVHIISENDLQGLKHSGRRMRARCPIHNGSERHLSIAAWSDNMDEEDEKLAGWGLCHSANCGVTVLVKEWNPKSASYLLNEQVEAGIPQHAISSEERDQAEEWQLAELAALNKLYPRMQDKLTHTRAQAYLAERGLSGMADLLARLGVGYIPPLTEWNGILSVRKGDAFVKVPLKKWCDRIVFPYTTREGEGGYLGRSLSLWEPGIDEDAHKKLLEEHEIVRYKKTYKGGYINKAALSEHRHVYLCEGPFDLIPLLHAGIDNALAVAGTEFDVHAIPTSVRGVTLAFDADLNAAGKGKAIARGCEKLGFAGITFDFLPPPDDDLGKDWSERYRRAGIDGLASLLTPAAAPSEPDEEETTPPALVSDLLPTVVEDESKEAAVRYEIYQWLIASVPFCAVCMNAGMEVEALDYPGSDDFMYCLAHHPEPQGKRITYLDDGILPPVRLFEGYSSEEYMQFIVDEKLKEIDLAYKKMVRKARNRNKQKEKVETTV